MADRRNRSPLAPGESFETSVTLAGEHAIHLLGGSTASTTLFAAPGAHDVVSAAGRFQLEDLRPGRVRLRAWHPRFPPAERWLQIEAGSVARVDVLMGVGQGKDSSRAD